MRRGEVNFPAQKKTVIFLDTLRMKTPVLLLVSPAHPVDIEDSKSSLPGTVRHYGRHLVGLTRRIEIRSLHKHDILSARYTCAERVNVCSFMV